MKSEKKVPMKIHETVIVGAGISGLACAHRLSKHKRPFIIITENIGGRILASEDGSVNYGAYYVREDYHHVRKFIKKKREIDRTNLYFNRGGETYKMLDKIAHYPLQVEKAFLILEMFKRQYSEFKKQSEYMSQKEAIESNPYLLELFNKKASDFIKEQGVEDFSRDFLEQILHASVLVSPAKTNAFNFLQLMMPFCVPIYTFKFLKDKLIAPFKSKIICDSVKGLKRKNDIYTLVTKKGKKYYTKNVDLATPVSTSVKLLKLKRSVKPIRIHTFHIRGIPINKPPHCQFEFFSAKSSIMAIIPQDGACLLFSLKPKPNFKHYFEDYEILGTKIWDPAYHSYPGPPFKCEQGENLYMIGDRNVWSLEDSYITGIYAANQINKSYKR
jgi:hypothetical protein